MLDWVLNIQAGYISTVLIIMSSLGGSGWLYLKRTESKRLRKLKRTEIGEAVETSSPEDESEKIAKHRAVASVENRFTLIRRLYVPIMLVSTAILTALPFLTILPAAYISLFASAIAVLVGLAARPLFVNLFAGLVITLSQPIRVGDTVVINGYYGTVEEINILNTVIKLWNWRRYVVPNHKLLEIEYENLSLNDDNEWAHISFWVEPHADFARVRDIAKQAMSSCKAMSDFEDPSFWVMEMGKDSVECWVAGWASTPAKAWALKSVARRNLITLLNEEGIKFQMGRTHLEIDKRAMP